MFRKFPQIKLVHKPNLKKKVNFWNFLSDIPEIDIVAGPLNYMWKERVKREIELFNKWKKIDPTFPFRNLRLSQSNDRRFIVEINAFELFGAPEGGWLETAILIPVNYPSSWPSIGDPHTDREFFRYLKSWTNNHPFCMPPVIRTWWRKYRGRAGIMHFLYAFSIFVTIAGRASYRKLKFILDL